MSKLLNITLTLVFASGILNLKSLETEEEFESGADTFDAQAGESGNWYEKRVLLKKAGPKRSKIKLKVQEIENLAKSLIEKRNLQEKEYKEFVSELGFQMVQVDQEIENFNKEISELKEKTSVTDQEKSYLEELTKKKTDLDQLKADLDLVNQVEVAVSGAMQKLDEQVQTAKNYQERAIKLYDAIADVLDDKKAKNYYLQMEALVDNVEAIERYLNTQFSSYMDISANTIKEHAQKIKALIKTLEENGVILNNKLLEQQKAEKEQIQKEKAGKKKVESTGILDKISDFILNILSWLAWPFVKLYQLIFGK